MNTLDQYTAHKALLESQIPNRKTCSDSDLPLFLFDYDVLNCPKNLYLNGCLHPPKAYLFICTFTIPRILIFIQWHPDTVS